MRLEKFMDEMCDGNEKKKQKRKRKGKMDEAVERNYQKANKIWQKMLFKEFLKDDFPSESDLESGVHKKLIKDFWNGIRKADLALSELARKF